MSMPAAAALGVLLASRLLFVQAGPPEPATLLIARVADDGKEVRVRRQTAGGDVEPVSVRESAGGQADTVALSIPCIPGHHVLETAARVSLPFELSAADCGASREIALYPASVVRGQVVVPAAAVPAAAVPPAGAPADPVGAAPLVVSLPAAACPEQGGGSVGQYRQRADADGRFTLLLPAAGCLDLGLRVAPYAPIPAVPRRLTPRGVLDLGRVELKEGATVVAAVRIDGAPAPGTRVAVVPVEDYERFLNMAVALSAEVPAGSASADRSGRVALIGVPPTLAYVIATTGDRLGAAGPMELSAGEEARAGDIDLRPLPSVSLSVSGDSSWTSDRPTVLGTPLTPGLADLPLFVATFYESTQTITRRLPMAGPWRFELRSGAALLDRQIVDVATEGTTSVSLSADRGRFRGRVFVGDEAVAGTLQIFAGGGEMVAQVATDGEGRFSVALAEPGVYDAWFSDVAGAISHARATARFSRDEETAVRLAATKLTGTVVFADGRPARDATVTVERSLAPTTDDSQVFGDSLPSVRSDARGAFSIGGLESGAYELSARLGGRKSETRRVSVGPGGGAPVQLVLPETDGLTLWVVNARGEGVPHAHGWVIAAAAESDGVPQTATFETETEGSARVGVWWARGSSIHVVLADADAPVAGFRVTPSAEGVASVMAPVAGGTVRLTMGAGAPGARAPDLNSYALVGERGAILPLGLVAELGLATTVVADRAPIVVLPSVASGNWQVVRFASFRTFLLSFGGSGGGDVLQAFTLLPGGTVAVDLR